MSKLPVVNWNLRASNRFKKIYDQILEDSYSSAQKVRSEINAIIDDLPDNPKIYPPDKYKKNNPGNYRAFEKHSYRIAYRHTEKEIRILRIRHVKQEPREY